MAEIATVTLELPDDLFEKAARIADGRGVSVQEWLMDVLRQELEVTPNATVDTTPALPKLMLSPDAPVFDLTASQVNSASQDEAGWA